MHKISSLSFSIAAALLLLSPIAYRGLTELPVPFVDIPDKSWLEGRFLTELGSLDKSSYLDLTFQNGVEKLANDSVPARDELMVAIAYLQKTGIDAAAIPFGFDLRHSYFGSDYVVDHANKIILHRPASIFSAKVSKKRLDDFIETINKSARNHPDIRFVVDQLTMTDQTEESPLFSLTSGGSLVDSSYVRDSIVDRFDDSVTAFCDSIESYDEIATEWFACDHHWSLKRASRSYNMIANSLDLAPFEYEAAKSVEVSGAWFGSNARSARFFDYPNTLYDIPTDYSNLSFFILDENVEPGNQIDLGSREEILSNRSASLIQNEGTAEEAISYTSYYGHNPVYVENSSATNGKTCLIVGDSFTHCLKRIIANNYEKTLFILPGNENCGVNRPLDSIIDEYKVDDVIVLTHCQKYNDIGGRSPIFIGE